jgi:phosphoglycolate phosphatase
MNFSLPSRDDIRRTVGMSLSESFTYLTKNNEPELQAMYVRLFKEKADEVMTQNTHLFQDTVHVLSYLKSKGIKTGIVTTKYRYRIDEVLHKNQITHLLDVIVGGDDVKNAKPDPEALLKAIGLLGASKDDVLYIGDSIIDARTANNANVDFIAVTTGTTAKDDFMQLPHIAVIDSLGALLSMVERCNHFIQ